MSPFPTECVQTLNGHKGPVNDVCYNKTGQYCLSGGRDRSVQLWNPSTGLHLRTYAGHGREVLGVAVAPDNSRIASCGVDRAVILWDVGSGEILRRYTAHWERVNAVDFNEEGTVAVSGSFDATIRLWDCSQERKCGYLTFGISLDPKPEWILKGPPISLLCRSSRHVKGAEIVAGCADGRLRIFDIRMGRLFQDYIGPAITSARLSKDSNCVVVSSLDDTCRLMDKSSGTLLNEFKGHRHTEYKIESTLTNTDAHVVSGSEDGHIYIWDVLEGDLKTRLKSHDGVVTTVDYHPSDVAMVSAGEDGCIRVWN